MAEPATAADLVADATAHRMVILAARERQEVLLALATLSAKAQTKIAQLQAKYTGAADAVGPGGCTPLLLGCVQGRVADVAALLALGADPGVEGGNISDGKHKCTPLMYAAWYGHVEMMKVLLTHARSCANQASSDVGRTALWFACLGGHAEVVKLLLAHAGIDANKATADEGVTPLNVACFGGHAAVVKLLLAHTGIDVNQAKTDGGSTPLFTACKNGNVGVIKLLLAHDGIDVNQANKDTGRTALFAACHQGHAEIVKLLLAHEGIAVNQAKTDTGRTPLFGACHKGHAEIVMLLLAHIGVDVNQATTDDGTTPLFVACHKGHAGIVKLLLAHAGIDANKARTDFGVTPLNVACFGGRIAVVKLLLAHDRIDVNQAKTNNGATPLYVACQKEHTKIIKLLLAHAGIDANKRTTDTGATPLHGAVHGGALLALQYLVVYGASLVVEDSQGRTPTQRAAARNKPELAEWLTAVSGWSQLRVAAGCRLYKEAAFLLRRGKIDPDDPAFTSVKDIMAVVATSRAKPARLPWRGAPQICKGTSKLVADATRGWHRTTHWLHHAAVREAAFAVLVVAGRLQEKGAPLAEGLSDARAGTGTAAVSTHLPLLPIEMWLFAMRFFKRSWWEVEGATA